MKLLLKYLAYVLIISSFFRILPITVGIIYKESVFGFIISALISLLIGLMLLRIYKRSDTKEVTLNLTKGLMLVALSFIILPIIGTIPFLPSFNYNFLNALFESVSGFTTTGLSLYPSLEGLPQSLLFWRAETQWMGGIGIIMVFLFIFSRLKAHNYSSSESDSTRETTMSLYQAQGFPEKLESGLKRSVTHAMIIYFGYTLLGIILLLLVGMPLFDSVAMAFTSLSTGGFSVKDTFYTNNLQIVVLCILMIIGSISFIAHNKLLERKFKEFFESFEKNVMIILILVSVLITMFVYPDLKVIFFQIISAFTTTGYSMTDISLLPHVFGFLIIIGMIIGGSMASTSGGIKVFRFYSLLKSIPWLLKKLSSPPDAVVPFKIQGKPTEEVNLMIMQSFVVCYFLILSIGAMIFMLSGYSFFDSFFQISSALGTVGLQTIDISAISITCKIVMIIAMILGRLEIFPLLILIRNLNLVKIKKT